MQRQKLLQLTLAIIKPDAMQKPIILNTIRNIIKDNFYIVRSSIEHLSDERAKGFYKDHEGKFFYDRLLKFMKSGESQFLILARDDAISYWRHLMGPTEVLKAQAEAPNSIRGRFSTSDTLNTTHGSDCPASAKREIEFIFPHFNSDHWYKNEEPIFRNGQVVFNLDKFIHVPK